MSNPSASASVRRSVDIRELPWVRRIAADYAFDFDRLAPFYSGNPAKAEAWTTIIARTTAVPRDRRTLAQALAVQQARRSAPEAARAAAALLAQPNAVAVVTGQQAGLFGGPLYTLLKALTTLSLAERIEREHRVPAVAVFWIDAEDHDWDEVASCAVLDAEDRLVSVTAAKPVGAGEGSVATLRLADTIGTTIDELAAHLPPTVFTDDLIRGLRDAYRPGRGMAEAFGVWLETVLGPLGLVVYDCSDQTTKRLASPVFLRELKDPGSAGAAATATGQALTALGYHAQVTAASDATSLFYLSPRRHAIKRAGPDFSIDGQTIGAEALQAEVEAHPERFSPNVLLRPVVQDLLFPTVCYVAGPSELAYLGQLKPIYDAAGVPMPLVFPRPSATILDSASSRFLSRYQMALPALQPRDEATLNQLLQSQLPESVEASLVQATRGVQEGMARVIEAVPEIDPTLAGAARSTLSRMEHDLQTLHSKIIQAAKRRDDTLRRQFTRARALAFPDGEQQERCLGFVHFVNQFGPAFIDALRAELPPELGAHAILTL